MTVAPAPSAAPAPPRRHRLRRWLLRIGATLLILLLIIAIIIQIVLWTGLPRSIVVSQIEKGFGLRISVSSLSTGWLGHTTLRGVKLALPLSTQSFLDAPEMRVRHTNLVSLLLGRPMQIKAVELDQPSLYVRQNAAGQWNLQEVGELVSLAGGKRTGEQTAQAGIPALPSIEIRRMSIFVSDNRNRQVQITPININGEPDSAVAWKYDVEVPSEQSNVASHLSLVGRVAPGGMWAHELEIWIRDIDRWIAPWNPGFNQQISFHGKWSGQLGQQGPQGYLQIVAAQLGKYTVDGALRASRAGGVTAIGLDNLRVHTSIASFPELLLPNGQLSYDGSFLRATQVQLALFGGPATFNGWYQPALRQGSLEAWWQDLSLPFDQIKQSGKLTVVYARPIAAPLSIGTTISTRGTSNQGPFEGVIELGAEGENFAALNWHLSAPTLAWYRAQQILLNGMQARGAVIGSRLTLDSLSLPQDASFAGSGSYDLSGQRNWRVHLEGRDFPIHLIRDTAIEYGVDASGLSVALNQDPKQTRALINLEAMDFHTGDAQLSIKGKYDGREPKPVQATATFANHPSPLTTAASQSVIHGDLQGQVSLNGVLDFQDHTDIQIRGELNGSNATVLGHPVGDMHAQVMGIIDDEKTYVHADGIPFLGGVWNLGGAYVIQQGGKPVYATDVTLSVKDLPLQRLTDFLKLQQVDGTFDGHWSLYFPGLNPRPREMVLTGGGTASGVKAAYLAADQITLSTSLQNGTFNVPVRLTRGNYGRIDLQASTSLNDLRHISAQFSSTAYPIDLPGALSLQIWGGADRIQIALPDSTAKDQAAHRIRASASMSLRSSITINRQPEGEVRLTAALQGRVLNLSQLQGDILGGYLTGRAVVDADELTAANAALDWKDLQADRVVRLFPQLKGFGGTYSGTARLAPATVPRPLEPLALEVNSFSNKGHWRTVPIGNAQVHAFVGPHRIISAGTAPNTIRLSGGDVDFWFSSSGHMDVVATASGQEQTTDITVSNQLNFKLKNIQVDPVVNAFDPGHKGYGHVNGEILLLSAPKTKTLVDVTGVASQPVTTAVPTSQLVAQQQTALQRILRWTTMDGNLQVENCDLGNFGPIAFLYNLMHLGGDIRKPTGHGSISLHMEAGKLHVTHVYYFNRGIEVHGVATVDQMWNFPDSPLRGNAAGSARPLKNVRIPLFAELDTVLTGLQGTLTAVSFDNTLHNPGNFKQITFSQIGSELRGILLGELGQASK